MKGTMTIFLFLAALQTLAQNGLKGTWQGLLIRDGQQPEQGAIIYFELTGNSDFVGRSREEVTGKDAFVVKKLKGTLKENAVQLKQFVVDRKKDASGVRWCNFEAELAFVDSTGYLEGRFKSAECRGYSGKIVCYRSEMPFTTEPTVTAIQSWRPIFAEDLRKGRKAPELREIERKNFQFEPIYFDHDKAEIRPEFDAFLLSLVEVVNGHSDLRIKVVGHTDADGSDAYNVDLSQRRAEAIIDFFVKAGLSRDRIRVEFKGESEPVGNNATREGKQLNRRVDFSFI